MTALRIAHVCDVYSPRVGGMETQVRDLARRQVADGHEVHVLTATAGQTPDGPGEPRVHRLATRWTFGLPVHPWEGPLLRRELTALAPDVVHVHAGVVSPFAYAGARAARTLGLPLAVTWHCMLDGIAPFYRFGARLAGWREAPMAVSAVSTAAAARVGEVLPGADVAVVPNGLATERWAPEPSEPLPPLPPEVPLRLVATQRLAPRKRVVPLVRLVDAAARQLGPTADGAPRVHLTLIGGGPEERAVRSEVDRLGLADTVDVLGVVERGELRAHYRSAHAFVAPARLEAFGIAALEARAAGLPVLAGRGTGIGDFITDGVDGVLTPDRSDGLDDAAADAALTRAVVDLWQDASRLKGMLRHSRAVRPPADWSDVLRHADELYARARDAAPPARQHRGDARQAPAPRSGGA